MMNRQRECEEIVTDKEAGKSYRFAGTFNFIRMLSLAGRDPAFIYADLIDGNLPPDEIKQVIMFSMEQINGEDVPDQDREEEAVELIERSGLVDASLLARIVMSHAMIGAIKKKQIRQNETLQGIIYKQNRSHWKNLLKAGFVLVGSLVAMTAASTVLVCMIIK